MRFILPVALGAAVLLGCAGTAFAESRIPAGGAFMNSYTSDPYFDPKSAWSQQHSIGDIGGQIMLAEPPGYPPACSIFDPACAARRGAWLRRMRHGSR
ncbi:hypothetical protein [Methylobacterium haplocladii]|uniref:Uncharacterized protein n=1 Tax=Methylobacterium haplocladii TaxID=1176176 RepID=A0A512INM6_9HYPH|nr:hypothetical protein [Methylobacterium haplocladii]GEO99252.1 hypothetical protein MHA02_16400 [Methylobacterium haplocladii]GJD83547.1 hypothetical protein HPGCJGGD_1416 [Methylobacterium haplocladii]GLS60302.1 hypothetical protein GCM10007887_29810 [Methylobacterium haplocladii]